VARPRKSFPRKAEIRPEDRDKIVRSVKFAAELDKLLTEGDGVHDPVFKQLWDRFCARDEEDNPVMSDQDLLAYAGFFARHSLQREIAAKSLGVSKFTEQKGPRSLTQVLNVEHMHFDSREDAEKFLLDNLHGRSAEKVQDVNGNA